MNDLNTQIAEVLGWTVGYWNDPSDPEAGHTWVLPDGSERSDTPNWQADMNACIRDLWPLAKEKGFCEFHFFDSGEEVTCDISYEFGTWRKRSVAEGPHAIPESFCKSFLEAMGDTNE